MKKEKQVKAYQRRTKSGKMVTVKSHTAKYDAVDKAMEAAKKDGAGKELEERRKKATQLEIPFGEEGEKKVLDEVKDTEKELTSKSTKSKTTKSKKSSDDKVMDRAKSMYSHNNPSGSKDSIVVYLQKKGHSLKEAQSKANAIEKAAKKERQSRIEQGQIPTTKVSSAKTTKASEPAFTAAEFKEWYNGTGSAADKKVAKALRAQLGRAGYRKLEDEAIDNYSSRGHLSMFKRVSGSKISH